MLLDTSLKFQNDEALIHVIVGDCFYHNPPKYNTFSLLPLQK